MRVKKSIKIDSKEILIDVDEIKRKSTKPKTITLIFFVTDFDSDPGVVLFVIK